MSAESRPVPEGHACVLPFDTESPDFARGFEAGRVWQRLLLEDGVVEETVHTANAEMALRMAEVTARAVVSEELDDRWMIVSFGIADDVSSLPRPDTS